MTSVHTENRKKMLTMAEYIERETLRDAVESIDWYSVYKGKLTTGAPSSANALYKANDIYSAIDNAPAADVAPVVHGRWIASHDEFCSCSICKYPVYVGWNQTNYCPNCGAKMDLEE